MVGKKGGQVEMVKRWRDMGRGHSQKCEWKDFAENVEGPINSERETCKGGESRYDIC